MGEKEKPRNCSPYCSTLLKKQEIYTERDEEEEKNIY